MSLLLDALNRASRDKAAGSTSQMPSGEPEGDARGRVAVSADTLAPASSHLAEANRLSRNASSWPPLEFSLASPDPLPVIKSISPVMTRVDKPVDLALEPILPKTPATIDPASTLEAQAALGTSTLASPVPGPAPAPAPASAMVLEPTTPLFKVEPAQLPPGGVRAAQNIVRAKEVTAPVRSKRWVMLLTIAVLLGAGMASVWLGLGESTTALAGIFGLNPEVGKTNAAVVREAPGVPSGADIQPAEPAPRVAIQPQIAVLTPITAPVPASPRVRAPSTQTVRAQPRDAPALPVQSPRPNDIARASVQSSSNGPSILESAYQALILGRLPEAGAAYMQALAINPEERDALLGLAYISQKQGRLDESLSLYKRVLRQEPGNVTARAGLLSLNPQGDAQDFGRQSREVAEQNPDSAAAQSALGHALVRQDRLADARVAFARAMQLAPDVPRHAFNLAVAFDRLHNYEEARRHYERAASLMKQTGSQSTSGFALADVMARLEQLRFAASLTDLQPN